MLLPKPNHECRLCGKKYYACNYCENNSYLRYACSPECYKVLVDAGTAMTRPVNAKELVEKMRAESVSEVSKYVPEVSAIGLSAAMDIINRKLEENSNEEDSLS